MLPDIQHALNRNFAASQRDGLLDGLRQSHAMLLRQVATDFVGRNLIEIQTSQPQIGTRAAILLIPFQNLPQDHIGMRVLAIHRNNARHRQLSAGRQFRPQCTSRPGAAD